MRDSNSMTKKSDSKHDKGQALSAVTIAFLENNRYIRRFLRRFLFRQQDIEDVAQEAYLRAYVAEQHTDIDHPKAFLFRIAKNVALTKLNRKSRLITDYLEESGASAVTESEAAADMEVEAQQSLGLYCEAVAALPAKCRQVFLLRKVHGLTHKQIAQRLSLSVSSVEKHLRTGVITCRDFVHQRDRSTPSEDSPHRTPKYRTEGKP
jgi:RNA polymerase sigma-70 factor (ECF subfamily)